MKFNQDIIKYLLTVIEKQIYWDQENKYIEDHKSHSDLIQEQSISKSNYSYNELAYHLQLMFEEGLLIAEYENLSSTDRTYSNSYQTSIGAMSPSIGKGQYPTRVRGEEKTYRFIGRETRLHTKNDEDCITHNVLGLSSKGQDTLAALNSSEFIAKTSKVVKQVGFNTLNALVTAGISYVVTKYT